MTESELKELESKARAATPGPWVANAGCVLSEYGYIVAKAESIPGVGSLWERRRSQAEYIAAANPEVVLALIAEIRVLRAEVARVWKMHNDFLSGPYFRKSAELHALRQEADASDVRTAKIRDLKMLVKADNDAFKIVEEEVRALRGLCETAHDLIVSKGGYDPLDYIPAWLASYAKLREKK